MRPASSRSGCPCNSHETFVCVIWQAAIGRACPRPLSHSPIDEGRIFTHSINILPMFGKIFVPVVLRFSYRTTDLLEIPFQELPLQKQAAVPPNVFLYTECARCLGDLKWIEVDRVASKRENTRVPLGSESDAIRRT